MAPPRLLAIQSSFNRQGNHGRLTGADALEPAKAAQYRMGEFHSPAFGKGRFRLLKARVYAVGGSDLARFARSERSKGQCPRVSAS
jgi:hypothetical protein